MLTSLHPNSMQLRKEMGLIHFKSMYVNNNELLVVFKPKFAKKFRKLGHSNFIIHSNLNWFQSRLI